MQRGELFNKSLKEWEGDRMWPKAETGEMWLKIIYNHLNININVGNLTQTITQTYNCTEFLLIIIHWKWLKTNIYIVHII